jgi:hypothetical protein
MKHSYREQRGLVKYIFLLFIAFYIFECRGRLCSYLFLAICQSSKVCASLYTRNRQHCISHLDLSRFQSGFSVCVRLTFDYDSHIPVARVITIWLLPLREF